MTLSTRIAFQWPPTPQFEDTSTLVFTSPGNSFVDIRIYKDKYPCKMSTDAQPFNKVFQWCLAGTEEPIENTSKILFKSIIDSQSILRSIQSNRPLTECKGDDDIGNFSTIIGSDDRKETGIMLNPETGKKHDYVEIWRSLDPQKNTPKLEVKQPKISEPYIKYVLDLSTTEYKGRIIRLGNWIQGIIHDKYNKEMPIHVIRSFFNNRLDQWEHQIEYGNINLFPINFNGKLDETIDIDEKVSWRCIEI